MAKYVYLNADRTKKVAEGSEEAAFKYKAADADAAIEKAVKRAKGQASAAAPAAAGDRYDELNKADLVAEAEKRDIDLGDRTRVAEIRDALRAADEE